MCVAFNLTTSTSYNPLYPLLPRSPRNRLGTAPTTPTPPLLLFLYDLLTLSLFSLIAIPYINAIYTLLCFCVSTKLRSFPLRILSFEGRAFVLDVLRQFLYFIFLFAFILIYLVPHFLQNHCCKVLKWVEVAGEEGMLTVLFAHTSFYRSLV